MFHLEQRPGVISLLAGKPHSSTFPITSLNFTVRDPANPQSEIPIELSQEELEVGLQYSPTVGLPALVDWAYGLQEIMHGRKVGEGWKISIGNGSQDLIYKVSRNRSLVCLPQTDLCVSFTERLSLPWSIQEILSSWKLQYMRKCIDNKIWHTFDAYLPFRGVIPMFQTLQCEIIGKLRCICRLISLICFGWEQSWKRIHRESARNLFARL